jgi:hypothetical protein
MGAITALLKKPDKRKIDAFKLWLSRRLLRRRRGQGAYYLNHIILPSLKFMARKQTFCRYIDAVAQYQLVGDTCYAH